MDWISLLLLSLALCFDSVAVSAGVGMCCNNEKRYIARLLRFCLILAIIQGAMPLLGWTVSSCFKAVIEKWDHWIAFILLTAIGGKMVLDYYRTEENDKQCPLFEQYTSVSNSIVLGFATSIDALIVGVTMALLDLEYIQQLSQFLNMCIAALTITIVTFLCSLCGAMFGKFGGKGLSQKSSILGGAILIIIGFKILFEHLF